MKRLLLIVVITIAESVGYIQPHSWLVDAHAAENGYSPFANSVDIFLSADMADIIAYAATQNPMAAKMATEEDVLPWLKSVQDEIRKEWVQQYEPVE